MSTTTQARLAETGIGRIVLHLACILNGARPILHVRGIAREIEHPLGLFRGRAA